MELVELVESIDPPSGLYLLIQLFSHLVCAASLCDGPRPSAQVALSGGATQGCSLNGKL